MRSSSVRRLPLFPSRWPFPSLFLLRCPLTTTTTTPARKTGQSSLLASQDAQLTLARSELSALRAKRSDQSARVAALEGELEGLRTRVGEAEQGSGRRALEEELERVRAEVGEREREVETLRKGSFRALLSCSSVRPRRLTPSFPRTLGPNRARLILDPRRRARHPLVVPRLPHHLPRVPRGRERPPPAQSRHWRVRPGDVPLPPAGAQPVDGRSGR